LHVNLQSEIRHLKSEPHLIRLRGPWQYRVLEPHEATGRITMPADWGATLGANFRGRVQYVRRFNRPTGLVPGQPVDLVFDGVDALAVVTLNDRPLLEIPPGGEPARIDIAGLLEERNTLVVEVSLPDDEIVKRPAGREHSPGGLYGEVRLEIHTP
jgi:beta-galactosidase/beta-glucuronidase